MASLGQLRVSPSGRIVGIELAAAFAVAQARGYDLATVSELLQEAEAILVQSLNEKSEDHGNSG